MQNGTMGLSFNTQSTVAVISDLEGMLIIYFLHSVYTSIKQRWTVNPHLRGRGTI